MKILNYLMVAVAITVTVNACSKTAASDMKTEASPEVPATEIIESTVIHAHLAVNGSCEMCKERIESASKTVNGVASAEWDGEEQQLHLNFDEAETSLEAISKAIALAGYDTELDNAPDDVYNALPECCKYPRLARDTASHGYISGLPHPSGATA